MSKDNITVLKYQENFADNLSTYAYGEILEKNTGKKFFFENITSKREKFEVKMSEFNLRCNYISCNRASKIQNSYLDDKKIKKEISSKKPSKKSHFLEIPHFKIEDIDYISDDIKKMFSFNNLYFVKNYDILEEITTSNSIGLYINEKDIEKANYNYIFGATKRLNKYIKKPKLFVFSDKSVKNKIKSEIDFKVYELSCWQEEFYFLTNCTHKIILNTQNSYSEGFWASVLNEKTYSINAFDKKLKPKTLKHNWIGV